MTIPINYDKYKVLSKEQIDFFLENGFVKIPGGMKTEWADKWTSDVFIRLGYDPNDKATWAANEKVNMPFHRRESAAEIAPKAWEAICELLGGEEKISPTCKQWSDSIIANFGSEYWATHDIAPKELDNWHVDGDFFRHFLDSPEQALLVIPLFADILPRGGGTYIAPDGIPKVAKYLLDHPEGTYPQSYEDGFPFKSLIPSCENFVEVTGKKGDVFLLHPLMLHSASKNHLRIPRFITNPPVSILKPFNFNRENPDDFSLVEVKTLRALGVDKLDFKPTRPYERVTPRRLLVQNKMLDLELERLKKYHEQTGTPIESLHLLGQITRADMVPKAIPGIDSQLAKPVPVA
ncbi:hypothetical protein DACRYDRAFT_90702 [Dacryopinax primogenitus]|uniref:Phytanoyl-CoA dioxygenase n=1 Tax=Dacryopinax primogenitus (strain DJM 731) TaxID=1858805 RepID=M5FUI1_DACPD|nr:uncharacterized protein DACRYDRAFT_90702 [Dacryopinax primogenitus]EJT99134.1 hypothetical protein DACRYDRAFT_90702 [Dacryopinax primogenitus]